MYGCYVEVVFNVEVVFYFVAKAILFLCFFGFDIYPYILFHFKKNIFYYSCIYSSGFLFILGFYIYT